MSSAERRGSAVELNLVCVGNEVKLSVLDSEKSR